MGTFDVITDPAAIIEFDPILTGAIMEVLDPINAPSSIVVSCLLTPS